ncbi:MAG TPA: hypothetical protein VGB17_13600 [Pyrinomonadaceae bacterium]|jgi:hypothetical protein
MDHAPEIRGFRLGMTLDQFKARVENPSQPYPAIKIPAPDRFGVISLSDSLNLLSYGQTATDLGDIRVYELIFIDNRLAHIMLVYADQTKWNNLAEFKPKIIRSFNLPDMWKEDTALQHMDISPLLKERHYDVWDEEYLDCNGFRIMIGFTAKNVFSTSLGTSGEIDRPFIRMTDLASIKMAEIRKAKSEAEEKEKQHRQAEEQQEVFKP